MVICVDLSKYELKIKHHVFMRALQRNIHTDLIEDTINKGKVKRFGKHGVKCILKGKRTIICVGELKVTKLTIEEGN
ncbi:MAG: hypothetical protein ACE5FT_00290 [Candidatus Nanoarchaeia archaeon]